jgi:hypothetical protein
MPTAMSTIAAVAARLGVVRRSNWWVQLAMSPNRSLIGLEPPAIWWMSVESGCQPPLLAGWFVLSLSGVIVSVASFHRTPPMGLQTEIGGRRAIACER